MKAVLAAVCAAVFLSGCSSEPTAKDFERFALQYAEEATGSTGSGNTRHAKLVRHNLRKTDSLTVPFVGEAEYEVTVTGVTFVHRLVPGYSTPAIYHNVAVISFGHVDGEWQPQEGTSAIVDVEWPELDQEAISKITYPFSSEPGNIPREAIANHQIARLNGWATMSVAELKKDYDLP